MAHFILLAHIKKKEYLNHYFRIVNIEIYTSDIALVILIPLGMTIEKF